MAVKKVIEIDVEQVQAMGGLKAFEAELQKTEEKSVSLKAELRKLKEELASLPEGSERYNEISKKAGEVSDKIGDINQRIKSLGSDTKNIDAVVEGTQAMAGAFSIAQSTSALFGDENEDLQKTLVKVEAATGLVVGIQSVANALQKDTALSIGLTTVATKIQTGAQVVYATVVGTTTGALKALRVALLSTGVGALVVGLGLLISAMDDTTESTENQEEALDNLTKTQERYNESLKNEIKQVDNLNKVRELRAKILGKSENEIREIQKQGEAERAEIFKREEERIDRELQNQKLSQKQYELLIKRRNELADEALAFAQERDINELEYKLDIVEKEREARKKQREEEIRKAKEKADELIRLEKERYEKLLQEAKDFFAKAKESQEAYDAEQIERIKLGKEAIDKIVSPEDDAVNLANKKIIELDNFSGTLSEKKALLEEYNLFVQDQEYLTDEARRFYEEQGLERKKIIQQQELALTAETFGKISELLGKNSKAGKAFAVAQALINTYQGITAELATKAVTPYEIGLKVVNVAYIAKTGFDAVKNILKTNTNGGSTSLGGSSTSSGGGNSTPQFNIVGQSSTNQLTQTIAGQQNQPIQTYVVGSQVTSQQALDRNAQQTSSF